MTDLPMQEAHPELCSLAEEIASCQCCPRLAAYLAEGRERHPDYWGRPVPGYGDPDARLVILGLAPGFHGANRHGRVFCGDDSGRWLWSALHQMGLCSTPHSPHASSPLLLQGVYVSNAIRCAPPQNRPAAAEMAACRSFLRRELALLSEARVVVTLGQLAHNSYLDLRAEAQTAPRSRRPFRHGSVYHFDGRPALLIGSYHPSRQNTNTGRLTWEMWTSVLRDAATAAGLLPGNDGRAGRRSA